MTTTSTASSPTTPKRTVTKSTASASKTRARAVKESPPPAPAVPPTPDLLAVVTERLNALEEKIIGGLSSLTAEIHALKPDPEVPSPDGTVTSETFLPAVADLIRRNLMEQVNPMIASLKRLEERVGFIGNRLKQPLPGGQEHRQKPWRHEPPQRYNRPRGQRPAGGGGSSNGGQQGQTWTPPSAASVQGHFAPRPLRGGESGLPKEDEE
jgi:hypothetical protein